MNFLSGAIRSIDLTDFLIWAGVSSAAAGVFFYRAFFNLRRARMIEDVPKSKVRSASQGYIELQGRGQLLDGDPIIAPLTATLCTWWSFTIEKRDDNNWKVVRRGTSDSLFRIEDETGYCVIDPSGAEVLPQTRQVWRGSTPVPGTPATNRWTSSGRYRYTESRMHPGDWLYAIGTFRSHSHTDNWDPAAEIRELLADWKRDQKRLLQRFDADGNGEIDLDEWEQARNAARRQIDREHRESSVLPGVHVLGKPADGRPFLLAALPQVMLAHRFRRRALLASCGFLATFVIAATLLLVRFGAFP